MIIHENFSLKPLHTFGIEARCDFFAECTSESELLKLISDHDKEKKKFVILGSGSNLLFTVDYKGTVIRVSTSGIRMVKDSQDEVLISVSAGEKWDDLVAYCVSQGWGGLENLSLIPGSTGAAPVQNIGAYGSEISEVISEVRAYDRKRAEIVTFSNPECEFSYRDSVFKRSLGRFIILEVTLHLSMKPKLNLGYGDLREELERSGVENPDIKTVRDAVCSIRRRKLPDPEIIGNAGSFFKNPVISLKQYDELLKTFPWIKVYPLEDSVKVSAAWLIDQCGWKGYRKDDAGVHVSQPLVLVNYGNATGKEILALAFSIQESVLNKFGITLEAEVNII